MTINPKILTSFQLLKSISQFNSRNKWPKGMYNCIISPLHLSPMKHLISICSWNARYLFLSEEDVSSTSFNFKRKALKVKRNKKSYRHDRTSQRKKIQTIKKKGWKWNNRKVSGRFTIFSWDLKAIEWRSTRFHPANSVNVIWFWKKKVKNIKKNILFRIFVIFQCMYTLIS